MKTIAIIPARYASTRLPGKMLLDQTGKPLIVHVVEAVRKASRPDDVVVATDDQRILRAVQSAGAKAVMTRVDHRCGTDRLAEAAQTLGLADDDIVVNVQGDEPDMPAECIDRLVELMTTGDSDARRRLATDGTSVPGGVWERSTVGADDRVARRTDVPSVAKRDDSIAPVMATLATPISAADAANPNRVKVVLAQDGRALYFSRARIPYDRDNTGTADYLLHLGIYAYRVAFMKHFTMLPPTAAEQAEKLEQLRALEHGYSIVVGQVDYNGSGIDTPEDYAAFVQRMRGK